MAERIGHASDTEDAYREILELENRYYRNEYIHYTIYSEMAKNETNRTMRNLLLRLGKMEKGHTRMWEEILSERNVEAVDPILMGTRIWFFNILRRLFGATFVIKLLEMNEDEILAKYTKLLGSKGLAYADRKEIRIAAEKEKEIENFLIRNIKEYERSFDHIRFIVLGLNDGLVEVLAAVAGFAAFTNSNIFVIIGGFIVGISGTLSMAGGVYLASKSESIINRDGAPEGRLKADSLKEAYVTGAFYLAGSLVPISPFILGAEGFSGIILAGALTVMVLSIASAIIAVAGNSSVKKRVMEMVAISVGAAAITSVIGVLARKYFGIF